jgi:hypothetical protein
MTNQHPITPPPELVSEWAQMFEYSTDQNVFNLAARWGADQQLKLNAEQIAQAYQAGANQELDACCKWLECNYNYPQANPLRAARRPKPPSLKEQALKALEPIERSASAPVTTDKESLVLIRRALEALPND